MKKFKQWWNSHFQKGTNRLVIVLKNNVIKIPKHWRGFLANKEEYENYCRGPKHMVAATKKFSFILVQEKLTNLEIFPLEIEKNNLPPYAKNLYDAKLHNRLQIGKNSLGLYKIFDYEDVKFYR